MKEHTWKNAARAMLLGLLVGFAMEAQVVPPLLNYQGRLTDEAGDPLVDGTYGLAFRLYRSAIPDPEERLMWGSEYDVTLLGGVFNVVL